jgi:adenosylmethionine-8-amino-7-oxononanoate aminotransferase
VCLSDANVSTAFTRDELISLDRAHLWRPYTSAEDHAEKEPLVIARAFGPWLEDVDGRRYLDGNGSWWVSNLGHNHPRLQAALARQAAQLSHCAYAGVAHEPGVLLAKELVAVAPPDLSRVFFSDDGSTALEVAVKIAFQYWQQNGRPQRTRFLSLGGGFHGDTLGAMSVGGVEAFRHAFGPLLFDTVQVSIDGGYERAFEAMVKTLRDEADSIAAVVVEPLIQGANGMRIYAPALLKQLREAATRADIFLIVDEVFTGYGRTGTFWAVEQADISPDLLCTAKGFSGGMLPMAATLATERLYDGFRGGKGRALMHGHSFFANPLGAAVAREVLAIYREENVLGALPRKAALIRSGFEALSKLPGVTGARSLGMVGACDLGEADYFGQRGWQVYEEARKRGAHLRPLGNTVYVTPALNIADHDLKQLLAITHDAIAATVAP